MARTAKEVGIRFAGHVPADVGLVHALEMGQETIDHVDGYIEQLNADAGPVDEAKLADIVRRTKQAGAWIVPTMALWETVIGAADFESMMAYPELKYMPRQQVENWKNAYRAASAILSTTRRRRPRSRRIAIGYSKALQDGGVRILFGNGCPATVQRAGVFDSPRDRSHAQMRADAL